LLLKIAENYPPLLDVSTVHVFDDERWHCSVVSHRLGLMLSVRLTATMADGVLQLIQQRRDELIWKHVAEALAKETWRDTC